MVIMLCIKSKHSYNSLSIKIMDTIYYLLGNILFIHIVLIYFVVIKEPDLII